MRQIYNSDFEEMSSHAAYWNDFNSRAADHVFFTTPVMQVKQTFRPQIER